MAGSRNKRALRSPENPHLQLQSQVETILSAHLAEDARIRVALSGGIDSIVLLHVVHALAMKHAWVVSALHVHHGLSPNADRWTEFCKERCVEMGVALRIEKVCVAQEGGEGPEAAARRERHRIFDQQDDDFLLLAHHRDDQAETVLHNLLRGCGVLGAAGMPAARKRTNRPCLIRPLLGVSRREIEAYARNRDLQWVEDESNEDTAYTRNFLRHEIMPRLAERFPAADRALSRAAENFSEASNLLDELAENDIAGLGGGRQVGACAGISADGLMALGSARGKNALRWWLRQSGEQAPSAVQMAECLRQLHDARFDAEVEIELGALVLRRWRGQVYCLRRDEAGKGAKTEPIVWLGAPSMPWCGGVLHFSPALGKGLNLAQIRDGTVAVRPRSGGEYLRLDSSRARRSVKNLLQEAGIPPWQRGDIPFVWLDDELAWVAGLGVDSRFVCAPGDQGVVIEWRADGDDDGSAARQIPEK